MHCMQIPSALQMLHQYRKSTEAQEGLGLDPPGPPVHLDINKRAGADTPLHAGAGTGEQGSKQKLMTDTW